MCFKNSKYVHLILKSTKVYLRIGIGFQLNCFWPHFDCSPFLYLLWWCLTSKENKIAVNKQQKVRKCITCKESGLALVIVQGVNRCWHKYFQAVTLRKTVLPDISCTNYTYRQIWIGKWDFYIKKLLRLSTLWFSRLFCRHNAQ